MPIHFSLSFCLLFFMRQRPPILTRTYLLFPYTSLFRSFEMGQTDQRLSILQFSAGDRSLGGSVHAAMHPVVLGADSHAISGDWCGIAMAELGTRAGGIWLFLNGAAGDNNPKIWSGHNNYDAMCSVSSAAAD